jgi:uncharacterized protein (DUF433 family)
MDTLISINLISTNPTVRSGRPIIAGTTIEVSVIAIARTVHGQTPEQIADDYRLTRAQVYAALAYYYEHQAEIDAQIEAQNAIGEAYKEQRIGSRHTPLFG